MRFVMLHSDPTSANEHVICESELASQSVLSRSALIADIHREDPEGCICMPCDTRTWTAWLTSDPLRMTTDNVELMLDVIRVRSWYTLEPCMLASSSEEGVGEVRSFLGFHSVHGPEVSQKSQCLSQIFPNSAGYNRD
jgi:hypothetical protein